MNLEKIIRGYDIRGIYGSELKLDDIKKIVNVFAQHMIYCEKFGLKVAVGMDNRPHSLDIFKIITDELLLFDVLVYDCGVTTSPALSYFAKMNCCFGIMITASHNNVSYNGLKLVKPDMQAFDGMEIRGILDKYCYFELKNKIGCLERSACNELYANFLSSNFTEINPNFRIAWNFLNGGVNHISSSLLQNLGNKNFVINIDKNNLKNNPDPLFHENIDETREIILKNHCDLGFAFDGDCDRVLVFDGDGNLIATEHLMMIFAEYLHDKIENRLIICDVKSSHKLGQFLKNIDYNLIVGEIGHSKMKKKMAETSAKLSGEISGHFIFDNLGFDDGLYTALFLMKILSEKKKKLSELMNFLPKIFCSDNIKVYLSDAEISNKMNNVENYILLNKISCDRVDGIKLLLNSGWILFRKSQTENCLTIRFEVFEESKFNVLENLVWLLIR